MLRRGAGLLERSRKVPAVTDHMRYLNRLLRQPRSRRAVILDPTKRADWPKFCQVCGADIRELPKGVRTCSEVCAAIRERQKYAYSADRLQADSQRHWRGRVQGALRSWPS